MTIPDDSSQKFSDISLLETSEKNGLCILLPFMFLFKFGAVKNFNDGSKTCVRCAFCYNDINEDGQRSISDVLEIYSIFLLKLI